MECCTCNHETLNDMQIVECIRMAMDKGHTEMAKEELNLFMLRLRRRAEQQTGG